MWSGDAVSRRCVVAAHLAQPSSSWRRSWEGRRIVIACPGADGIDLGEIDAGQLVERGANLEPRLIGARGAGAWAASVRTSASIAASHALRDLPIGDPSGADAAVQAERDRAARSPHHRAARRRSGREARTRLSWSRRAVTRSMRGSRSTPWKSWAGFARRRSGPRTGGGPRCASTSTLGFAPTGLPDRAASGPEAPRSPCRTRLPPAPPRRATPARACPRPRRRSDERATPARAGANNISPSATRPVGSEPPAIPRAVPILDTVRLARRPLRLGRRPLALRALLVDRLALFLRRLGLVERWQRGQSKLDAPFLTRLLVESLAIDSETWLRLWCSLRDELVAVLFLSERLSE